VSGCPPRRPTESKVRGVRVSCVVFLVFTVVSSFSPEVFAASPVQRAGIAKEAEIVSAQGEGWVRFVEEKDWIDALRQQVLTGGDTVRTGPYGKMGLLFVEGTQIKVNRKSTLSIRPSAGAGAKGTVLGLSEGEIWSRARAVPGGLRIETPSATAAIRGTDWDLLVDEKGTSYVTVLRGVVEFYNDFGSLLVNPGEQATAEVGRPPVKTVLIKPKDRVQWVVSYQLFVPDLVRFGPYRRGEALKELSSARERTAKDPSDREAAISLAETLYDLKQRRESLALVEDVLSKEPSNRRALVLRGYLFLDAGRTDEAEGDFERALKAKAKGKGKSGRIEAKAGLAGVALARNEVARAGALVKEIAGEDRSPLAGLLAASFEAYLGDFRKALRICVDQAKVHPSDERFRILAAGLSLLIDERVQAREFLAQAFSLNPESSEAHAVLGACEHLEGRGKFAEDAYRKSLDLDPDNAGAMGGLGVLLMEKGDYSGAERELSKGLLAAPRASMTWANRGVLYSAVEELAKARDDLAKSLSIDPTNFTTLNGQGLVALKEGRNEEAVRHFLKASLLEPNFSQPHTLLAIAYYQQGDVARALEEVRLAESLDPRDPFPHLVAYLIRQDTYRPYEAVKEAARVLELIPNLKSVDEVENTRAGLSNLGSALSGFGLSEWAESYAQESFDPHVPSSHFFASRQYNNNHTVAVSELVQGVLLDPLSVSTPTRFQDIVRRPRNDLTLTATLGEVKEAFTQSYQALAQGYLRKHSELSYFLSAQGSRNDGYVVNGDSRGYSVNTAIGYKPDYNNGYYLAGFLTRDKSGYFGSLTDPDPDNRLETTMWNAEAGYHRRFGPKNDLLFRAAAGRSDFKFINPSPFGSGLSDIQLSFLNAGWTADETREFFRQGVYDVTAVFGGASTSLATDSTGVLGSNPSIPRLPPSFPARIDFDTRAYERTTSDTKGIQLRHLFRAGDRHEVTYGLEGIFAKDRLRTTFYQYNATGSIDFYEEFFLPTGSVWTFPLVSPGAVSTDAENSRTYFLAYLDDRWKPVPGVLVEGGAFFFVHDDDRNETRRLFPKIGLAVDLTKRHVLRAGFQKWMEQPSLGTLSPLTNAGLVINNSLAIDASELTDYQVRLESRWTERLFSVVGAERVDLKDPTPGEGFLWRAVKAEFLSAAVNAILTERIGFFLRYLYAAGKGTDGPLDGKSVPDLPRNVYSGGLVAVFPNYVKASLSTSRTGESYSGYSNVLKTESYWTTSAAATWEPLKKRLLLALGLNNLFNNGSPAPPRSSSATLEYRF
jgi:Flp pilus assembly protein TadD